MSAILISSFTVLLFVVELVYFKLADHYSIIDKPNHRSSHSINTIRGGGILFAMAMLIYPFFFGLSYIWFLIGMLIISFVSFLDDLSPVSNKIRVLCHFLSVGLVFYQLQMFNFPIYLIAIGFILAIGIINAINFMDGINGITGAYALVTLISLLYINELIFVDFTSNNLIIVTIIAVSIFNFFNFRTRAKCFAGDVGSVGIAFILIFLIGQLIIVAQNAIFLLLLFIYGLDTITTIFFRLIRRENIFEAHRSHYYQYLVNERHLPHLYVSIGYATLQLTFNVLVVFSLKSWHTAMICIGVTSCIFVLLRFYTEGRERLLKDTTRPI